MNQAKQKVLEVARFKFGNAANFLGPVGMVSYWTLVAAMKGKGKTAMVTLNTADGLITGIIQGFDRESGDGCCFNVRVFVNGSVRSVFVRTID